MSSFKNVVRALRRELEQAIGRVIGRETERLLGPAPEKKKRLPYRLWAALPKRKPAPIADTRQCVRRALAKIAFLSVTTMYPGEPRAARRRMARSMAKSQWREQRGLVAA